MNHYERPIEDRTLELRGSHDVTASVLLTIASRHLIQKLNPPFFYTGDSYLNTSRAVA